jgi:integrase
MPIAHTRSRYQEGSIDRVPRAKEPDVWVYRWRKSAPNGKRVQHKRVIGTVEEHKTLSEAKRAVDNLRLEVNSPTEAKIGGTTVAEAGGHFQVNELRDPDVDRSPTTIELYLDNFKLHIIPRWGGVDLNDVKAVGVEKWLRGLDMAPATKSKLKSHLSVLFSHAIRHELYCHTNPIASVRQSAKRLRIPDILSLSEIGNILGCIKSAAIRTAILVAAATGLRRSEVRGMMWCDLDFDTLWLSLRRGRVRGHNTKLKTEASRKGIPIPQDLADALTDWRQESLSRGDDDWVFASPTTGGRTPIWLDVALQRYIRPAVLAAKIDKIVGWHTFRRSLATLLSTKGENIKVVQELLRHANSATTRDLYQQADLDAKRAAQEHTSELFLVKKAS